MISWADDARTRLLMSHAPQRNIFEFIWLEFI